MNKYVMYKSIGFCNPEAMSLAYIVIVEINCDMFGSACLDCVCNLIDHSYKRPLGCYASKMFVRMCIRRRQSALHNHTTPPLGVFSIVFDVVDDEELTLSNGSGAEGDRLPSEWDAKGSDHFSEHASQSCAADHL
jgi:hypothetical protein